MRAGKRGVTIPTASSPGLGLGLEVGAEAFEPVRPRVAGEIAWNPCLGVVGAVCVAAGHPFVGFEVAGDVHVIGLGEDGLL